MHQALCILVGALVVAASAGVAAPAPDEPNASPSSPTREDGLYRRAVAIR